MHRGGSPRDILSGMIFLALGGAFGVAAAGYEIGTAFRMGPGYFPLALAGGLATLGAAIVVKGLRAPAREAPIAAPAWRGAILILGSVAFFGAALRGLGLAPCLFLTVLAAALASPENRPVQALVVAAAITLLCLLVFSVALRLPLPLVGPWLGG